MDDALLQDTHKLGQSCTNRVRCLYETGSIDLEDSALVGSHHLQYVANCI